MRNRRFVAQLLILMYLFVSVIAVCDYLDRKNADEVNELNDVRYTHKCRIDKTDITYLPESRPEENETVLSFELYHCGGGEFPYNDPIEVSVDCPESILASCEPTIESLDIPFGDCSSFMFMDYRALTDISSKQWELQQYAYDGNYGIRMVDGCYCVATSSMYGDVGDKIRVTTDRGNTYWCIIADIKGYDSVGGWYHVNSQGAINLIEFVVDSDYIPNECWQMGDMGVIDDIGGDVIAVER